MKFTEEQYQQIIKSWGSENNLINSTERVTKLVEYFVYGDLYGNADEAIALGNEVTREWAYEQFVEKEKRYVWTSERKTGDVFMRLYKSKRGYIGSTLVIENGETGLYEKLTESEIREWGYNPEMFNKEEVE